MVELFRIKDIIFYEEDFLDDIKDYVDIIPIIKEMESKLNYETIACTEQNECCKISKNNHFTQLYGYINEEDEFLLNDEVERYNIDKKGLDLFVIRIYKCCDCGKWIIDILED